MSERDNVKFVRRLWAAIGEGGLEGALELTAPEVEWKPHAAGGRVLTSQQLLGFFHDFQGERQLLEARPYSFHAHGDQVLASGSFRLRGRDRMAEFQIHFVYDFDGGRLVRATADPRVVRVEVSDPGPGFDERVPRERSHDGEGGFGLFLVDKVAHRWGTKRNDSTRVWFEIDHRSGHDTGFDQVPQGPAMRVSAGRRPREPAR